MIDPGNGELSVHAKVKAEVTHNLLKHYNEIWIAFIMGLIERGFTYVTTWIEQGDLKQYNFATFFGFEETGFGRHFTMNDGEEKLMIEMRYSFPDLDEE